MAQSSLESSYPTTGPLGYILSGAVISAIAGLIFAVTEAGYGQILGSVVALAGSVILLVGVIAAGVRLGLRSLGWPPSPQ